MRSFLKYLLCFLSLATFAQNTQTGQGEASGQQQTETADKTPVLTAMDTAAMDLVRFLPPLNELIDSALQHSPEIGFYNARVKQREYEVQVEKLSWARDISFGAQYNYGNLGSSVLDQINLGYQFSIGVRLPLSTFVGRSDRIGVREAEREAEIYKRDEIRLQVTENVIAEYNKLLLLQRLLRIQSDAKESAEIISEMAETRFRDGELSLDQIGSTTELKAKYNVEYEELRTEFNNTYFRLERLVGVPFSKFERQ